MRDIQRAYRDAMIAEYEALTGAGRKREAEHVKHQLAEQFGYTVADEEDREPVRESAVDPKPGRRAPRQPAGRKAADKENSEG